MIKARRNVHLVRRSHGRQVVATEPPRETPGGRIPRVSRLMALAIHFDRLILEGKVSDQSQLARLAHVTQPRMTQIMNLNLLAPDIQEEILFLPHTARGRDPMGERDLRPSARSPLGRHNGRCGATSADSPCELSGLIGAFDERIPQAIESASDGYPVR